MPLAYITKCSQGNTFDKEREKRHDAQDCTQKGNAKTMTAHNLADPKKQAAWFEHVRKAHQSETAEDYVELIADLIEATGEARVGDLSKRIGVSHTTVNKIIIRLKKEGLVISQPYRSLFLSEDGKALAEKCKQRHIIVLNFLKAIGVRKKTAELDAEGIEHHVSEETLCAFQAFIDRENK